MPVSDCSHRFLNAVKESRNFVNFSRNSGPCFHVFPRCCSRFSGSEYGKQRVSYANSMVYSRKVIYRSLHGRTSLETGKTNEGENNGTLSWAEYRSVAIAHGIPFIGFGFLDNAVMILAGEYIDITIGQVLGISTMAAAGLGNLISDVFGMCLVGYVETVFSKFGLQSSNLSKDQMQIRSARVASFIGRCVGLVIGCLIGMLPLLFFTTDDKDTPGSQELQ